MLSIQLSLYALACGLCLFTIAIVWLNGRAHFFTPMLLFLAIEAFSLVCEWLMFSPLTSFKGLWLTLIMSAALLIAPLLSWLTDTVCITEPQTSRTEVRWHLVWVVSGVLLLLPLISSIHGGQSFYNTLNPVSVIYSKFIHTTMLMAAAVFVLQSCTVIQRCIARLKARVSQNKVLFAELDESGTNVLRVVILSVIANLAVNLVRVLYCMAFDDYSWVNFSIAGIQAIIVALACLRISLYVNDNADQPGSNRRLLFLPTEPQEKYQNSSLDDGRRHHLLARLDTLLQEERVYLNSDITLSRLSEMLSDTPHNVSQLINQSHHTSFYDMVNSLRVRDAQVLLIAVPEKSILEVAYEVGYNSKSTFNSAFKKFSQLSPSEFRRQGIKGLGEVI